MPPDDDFARHSDPRARRNALVAGAAVAAALLALLAGVLIGHGTPTATTPSQLPAQPTRPNPTLPQTPGPTPVPSVPVLGSGFSAAYDNAAHQLVVFGGVDSYDSTWTWNGRRWTLARPPASPPGRFNAAAAYDPLTGVVMLYGGRLGPGDLVQDTWAWDGTTWKRLDTGTTALPAYAVMAWDDIHGEMILADNFGTYGGTWVWSGSSWVRQPRAQLPAGTFLIGVASDPVSRTLLGVSCCSEGQGDVSTLAWDGAVWRRLVTSTVPGFTVSMVRDPVGARVLMFGDPSIAAEVWSWTGADWRLLPNERVPVFPTKALVDPDTHRVVIIGSVAEPVQGSPQPVQLWTLLGSSWQRLA